jgi:hypothetical protein
MATFASDYSFGTAKEIPTMPLLESFFNTSLKCRGGYAVFDYDNEETKSNNVLHIDLKSRRIRHDQYATAIIGANKVEFAEKNPNRTYWFVFKYLDGLYGIKYTKELFDTFAHTDFSRGDRSDFHNTPQHCYFIPSDKLVRITDQTDDKSPV